MGEFPARIVAEDFVTPPEFGEWGLASNGAGRIGGARIALAAQPNATRLANLYEQIPIRVIPLDLGPSEPALIYLLNPTAGLMDRDAHLVEIQAGAGTRAVVTGQSATRIHPCLEGFCTQQWKVTVAEGAILVVLPGPAIPFRGCRYFQRIQIDLAKNAQLFWGDIWFAGRYSRCDDSEQFCFDRIVQEMQIHREGRLVFRDRFAWNGPWNDELVRWQFDGAPAAGSLFATGAHSDKALARYATMRAAEFTTAAGDTICRCLDTSESVIRAVVETCLRRASLATTGRADEPWLLKRHHLAPTHWFDVT